MHFPTLTVVLAGIAVAAPLVEEPAAIVARQGGRPDGFDLFIKEKPTAKGNGCPSGTVVVTWSKDEQIFTVDFEGYNAQTGPAPLKPADSVKNCKITALIGLTKGFTISIFETEMSGTYSLDAGVSGKATTDVSFTGGVGRPHFEKAFRGPASGVGFNLPSATNLLAFSRCGAGSAILNINTGISLSPLAPQPKKGFVGVADIQGSLRQKFHVRATRC